MAAGGARAALMRDAGLYVRVVDDELVVGLKALPERRAVLLNTEMRECGMGVTKKGRCAGPCKGRQAARLERKRMIG